MVKPVGEKPKPWPDLLFSSSSPSKNINYPLPPNPNCRVVWCQESPWVNRGQVKCFGSALPTVSSRAGRRWTPNDRGRGNLSSRPPGPVSLQAAPQGAINSPSVTGGSGISEVPLENFYNTGHPHVFAECLLCSYESTIKVD